MQTWVDEEIRNGMKMMKYSVNHWWKFKNHRVAFTVGLLQYSALTAIALVNYLVVMISGSVLDIAKDFTALLIISDFDDIFAGQTSGNDVAMEIITSSDYEELFLVETTTSHDANKIGANKLMRPDLVHERMV